MMGVTKAAVVAMSVALAGCAVRQANLRMFEDQRALSNEQRAALASEVRRTFFDPYSIRDAEISNAAPTITLDQQTVYMVCVRANAKNQMGAYVGKKATLYYLNSSGKILNTSQDEWSFCDNPQLAYKPFPEIEEKATR
jgi:hypothetical protein